MSSALVFKEIRTLLKHEGDLSWGAVIEAAGSRAFGILVLLLAIPNFIPGLNSITGPFSAIGCMTAGIWMIRGMSSPWIPKRLRTVAIDKKALEKSLDKLESWIAYLTWENFKQGQISNLTTGLGIIWCGFLLFLPSGPIPFGNIFPAFCLSVLSLGMLEKRPAVCTLGLLLSLINTLYFIYFIQLLLAILGKIMVWLSPMIHGGI